MTAVAFAMRLKGSTAALLAALACLPAAANGAEPPASALSPPRGSSARAYLDAVAAERLQTDLVYLPENVPLDGEVEPPPAEHAAADGVPAAQRGVAWVVLALFAALALFLLVRNRHALAEIFGRGDRRLASADVPAGSEPAGRAIDHDLLARLRAESDPRRGLRLVLQHFLALAARENRIALTRSLTTRELLSALPDGWRHRGDLDALAGRVELVVFGGRDIDRPGYEECLALAAPLLFRVEAT